MQLRCFGLQLASLALVFVTRGLVVLVRYWLAFLNRVFSLIFCRQFSCGHISGQRDMMVLKDHLSKCGWHFEIGYWNYSLENVYVKVEVNNLHLLNCIINVACCCLDNFCCTLIWSVITLMHIELNHTSFLFDLMITQVIIDFFEKKKIRFICMHALLQN